MQMTLDGGNKLPLSNQIWPWKAPAAGGWHQDWCIPARERLQTMYLGMLNKLMARCARWRSSPHRRR
jgi:hypothetical protein